jgi:hypothetical protein
MHIMVLPSAAVVLSPEVVCAHFAGNSKQPIVWAYCDSAIDEVVDRAFVQIKPEHLAEFPVYCVSKQFPYFAMRVSSRVCMMLISLNIRSARLLCCRLRGTVHACALPCTVYVSLK